VPSPVIETFEIAHRVAVSSSWTF